VNTRVSCFLQAVFVWIAVASANPGAAVAQSNPPTDAQMPGNHILINVVVTDKKGQPIHDLQAGDFTVLDNKAPQKLLAFRAVNADTLRQDPVHVVMVVDTINSPFNVVAQEREQFGEFLKQNGGELVNPTSIGIFAESGAKVDPNFSRDGNALNAALTKQQAELRAEGRNTGFYGAADRLRMSLNQLSQLLTYEATVPGRKLVLVVGPGWPLFQRAGEEADMKQRTQVFNSIVQLTNSLLNSQITLYCIDPYELGRTSPFYYQSFLKGVSAVKDAEYSNLALQVLAEHSGGQVLVSGPLILGALNSAVHDATSSYELTFEAAPGDRANEYHAIEVRVNRPNIIVRTAKGYYAHTQSLGK
jgi:VWFA-related protein